MQDASQDLMRTTYPPRLPPQAQTPIVRKPSPRIFSPSRARRDKGKGRALFIPRPPPPAGEFVGQCRWHPGLGYICELCARLCVVPVLHWAHPDGSGCTDVSGWDATLAEEVARDVERDPEAAVKEAEVAGRVMAGLQRRQMWDEWEGRWVWVPDPGQEQLWYPPQSVQWIPPPAPQAQSLGFDSAPQPWGGEASGPADYGIPGASTSTRSFTSLSQMQQWGKGQGQGMSQAGPSQPPGGWQGG